MSHTDISQLTKDDLSYWLSRIDKCFGIENILNRSIDNNYIVNYYKKSDIGYRVVHSRNDAVHMALNFDGRFDKDGYYEQARFVEKHIREVDASDVLELASGKGFNSLFLATRNPDVTFTGVDLLPKYIKLAQRRSKNILNLHFQQGNFQELPFADSTFDFVFEVEGICHATNMQQALGQVSRVLRPGGRFILFDGFRCEGFSETDKNMQLAAQLVEKAMAIKEGWILDAWLQVAQKEKLQLIKVQNFSDAIMPNLMRFQRIAKKYFDHGLLRGVFLKYLSPFLLINSIAGLLMPFTLQGGAQGYFCIELNHGDFKNAKVNIKENMDKIT